MARGMPTWRISASGHAALFDAVFQHVEGYEGLPDLAAVQAFILGAQRTAAAYARNYPGTVKEIRKAAACERRFPAGAGRSRRPPRRCSIRR